LTRCAVYPFSRFDANRLVIDLDFELVDIEAEHRPPEVVNDADVDQHTSNVNAFGEWLL
jgi:hypothetical protein